MIAFSKNPSQAIVDAINKNEVGPTSKEIAKYLVSLEGLNKVALGEYFGSDKDENKEVLR